jgi:regulator of sigma E protease
MLGEDATSAEYEGYDAKESSKAFNNKPVWKRCIVILAGVFMNFALALLVAVVAMLADALPYALPIVSNVIPDTPAEAIGLQPGDRIIEANGTAIHIAADLSFELYNTKGAAVPLTILRNNEKIELTVTPKAVKVEPAAGYEEEEPRYNYIVGFNQERLSSPLMPPIEGVRQANVFECLENAFFQNIFYVRTTFVGLAQLITGNLSFGEMSGPIGVVSVVGEVYDTAAAKSPNLAFVSMLDFMAILSVNIGIFNLLPLPALDGGRFAFLLVEGIRKKPVKPETEGMVHFVGLALLMILAVFVAFNDILKLIR